MVALILNATLPPLPARIGLYAPRYVFEPIKICLPHGMRAFVVIIHFMSRGHLAINGRLENRPT